MLQFLRCVIGKTIIVHFDHCSQFSAKRFESLRNHADYSRFSTGYPHSAGKSDNKTYINTKPKGSNFTNNINDLRYIR
jgi:outer membrane usher protein FimD/PapC